MPLTNPNLDDRGFQDLVDDAKRFIQRRCPEWTDHNVSDPGVALIESFAWMTDLLLYRVNLIPDRVQLRLLELLGLKQRPPAAATVEVDLHLSAPPGEAITVPRGFRVSTSRSGGDEPIVFSTTEVCTIQAASARFARAVRSTGDVVDLDGDIRLRRPFELFATEPAPGDSICFGFPGALDRHIVLMTFVCPDTGQGVGIDTLRPPLRWQASTLSSAGELDWADCEVGYDTTAGFNATGVSLLHLPRRHAATTIGGASAFWIRCVVTEPPRGTRAYRRSPVVSYVSGETLGASVDAINGEYLGTLPLGISDGTAGQEFHVDASPIASGTSMTVELGTESATATTWERWAVVERFADSGPGDRHVEVDVSSGLVRTGPAVRLEDGSVRQFGAIPTKGSPLRITDVVVGGGERGNVKAHSIVSMPQSFPQIDRVDNRRPSGGGRDGDQISDLMARAPLLLRSRGRAVTAEDYELMSLDVAPRLVRAHCQLADESSDGRAVRLCFVPSVTPGEDGEIQLGSLAVSPAVFEQIRAHLEPRRMLGINLVLEDTGYVGVSVDASVQLRNPGSAAAVSAAIVRALNDYLSPVTGGPNGTGWPFERPLRANELYGVILGIDGVELVDDVALRLGDPRSRSREDPRAEVRLRTNALFLPFGHQITTR